MIVQQPSIVKPLLILSGALVVMAGMYLAAPVLTPVLFALFIAALLTPIHRWFKRRMSGALALLLSIGVLALVTLFLVLLVGNSLTALASSLASYEDTLGQRKAELEAMAGDMGQTSALQGLLSVLDPAALVNLISFVLDMAASLFSNGLLILFVIMFALGEGSQIIRRMIKCLWRRSFPAPRYQQTCWTRSSAILVCERLLT